MESTHYSEVKAVRRRDAGKKKKRTERGKDGWVGHRLGSGPSSGLVVVLATARLTLFTPSHTSRHTRTPLSPVHISFAALVPWQPSLRESWNSSPCAPPPSPHTTLTSVATSTRSRWGSQVRPHFSAAAMLRRGAERGNVSARSASGREI